MRDGASFLSKLTFSYCLPLIEVAYNAHETKLTVE